jgi:hypothetical protein
VRARFVETHYRAHKNAGAEVCESYLDMESRLAVIKPFNL